MHGIWGAKTRRKEIRFSRPPRKIVDREKTQYVRQGVFRKATLFHPKSKVRYPRYHNEKLHVYALSIQRAAFLKKCFTYWNRFLKVRRQIVVRILTIISAFVVWLSLGVTIGLKWLKSVEKVTKWQKIAQTPPPAICWQLQWAQGSQINGFGY